jgi:thiamine biosynthesis lipoprotein
MKLKLFICLIVCLPFLSFTSALKTFKFYGQAQGTTYNITYYATTELVSQKQINTLLDKIDQSMSLYKENSLINVFNNKNKSIKADAFMRPVLEKSFEINKATKGIFDITVAPLVQAWGFGPKETDTYPDSLKIIEILSYVGMNNLSYKNFVLKKSNQKVKIDLNGIAQGYSVDLLAQLLEKSGIKNYIVELGGEIRVLGQKPDGSLMRIGVEGPDENDIPAIKHVIAVRKGALTTSGNYRKFHQNGNKKYSHLINPKTGYPIQNEMISVTVFAKDALTADGYDNALMGMSLKQALSFVEKRNFLEAYIVYHNEKGKICDTLTAGFKKIITNQN